MVVVNCKFCGRDFHNYPSNKRIFCSKACHSRHMSATGAFSRSNNPKWSGGDITKICVECSQKFTRSLNRRGRTAKFCSPKCRQSNRNEGKSPWYKVIRKSLAYKAWRTLVFNRDNYTCQSCQKKGGYLHADHIKPFALFPELRFDVNNGRTLCVPCHKNTGTYGRLRIYREAA